MWGRIGWEKNRTELRPVIRSEEIGIVDGAVDNEENPHLLKVIKLRRHERVGLHSVIFAGAYPLDGYVLRNVIWRNHSGRELRVRNGVIQPGLFPVLNLFDGKIPSNDTPGGCLTVIHKMYDPTDWPERLEYARIECNFYPRALVFPHRVKLTVQNNELVDSRRCKEETKNGYPFRRIGGDARRLFSCGFFCLVGIILVHFAFYVVNEPEPPITNRLLY